MKVSFPYSLELMNLSNI